MDEITFDLDKSLGMYTIHNARIDEFGLSALRGRYGDKGFGFFNDGDDATIEWPEGVSDFALDNAYKEFVDFLVFV